ncbi:MAG TPA: hypothetical protein VJT72_08940 [Pseudonocardiaceae bacterium]|nr:hypothetical protein [Pseudonocardiaceae bacterium]
MRGAAVLGRAIHVPLRAAGIGALAWRFCSLLSCSFVLSGLVAV